MINYLLLRFISKINTYYPKNTMNHIERNPFEMKDSFFKKIITFFKNETVFCVASLAAIISCFFVSPSAQYISYIDFRVLAILFCLMLVVAGFQSIGLFDKLLPFLMQYVHTLRQLALILVLSCFFLSMWITNDVALITLVPFAIMVLTRLELKELLIPVVTLQTIAANLGSMGTPIGNPQNLFLYTISEMSVINFANIIFPYLICSLILVILGCFYFPKTPVQLPANTSTSLKQTDSSKTKQSLIVIYSILLTLCLLTVFRLLDYRITLACVIVILFFVQKTLFKKADYILLLTFIAFFIFVGNLKNVSVISTFLGEIVNGHEELVSILSSQIISNVPAAVLLSGFTTEYCALIVGTNLGGLGTLIASMASLISFKYYCNVEGCNKKKYLVQFTIWNIIYLVILVIIHRIQVGL